MKSNPYFALAAIATLSLITSCCTSTSTTSVETKDGLRGSAEPVTVEDLCGVLGLRLTKFNYQKDRPLDIIIQVQRGGQPQNEIERFVEVGKGQGAFTVGYRVPAAGAERLTLFTGFQPVNLDGWQIPNPNSATREMRGFDATPLRRGRTVLMVWNNVGGNGWNLDDQNFIQRLVIYLR